MTAVAWALVKRKLRRVIRRLAAWAAASAFFATGAHSQEDFRVTVQSNYLLRGVSLSDGRPTLSLDLDYDDKSGLYGAVSVTAADTRRAGAELMGVVADVGYARRLANGFTWDVGVSDTQVSTFAYKHYVANYAEAYAGVTRGGLAAHLYISPNYLGERVRTLYLDLSGTVRPADHWRLYGHAGLLTVAGGETRRLGGRSHVDLRAGVAREFGQFEARLTASWIDPAPVYPEGVRQGRATLAAGGSLYF